ncbi:LPD38 domain-containing protein [Shewanella sp. BJSY2023SW005]|uniref:LPD38 domain-containing protein n=1 Tax=Shewanella sp. BJSY2023SW005 TaxID=3392043 RepID=UPI0039B3B65C
MSLLNFDPNQYRTQSPTQQSQTSQQQGRFADSVDMFQAGAASGLGGIFDFFGADGIAKSLYGISDDQFGQLSDRGREAMSKPMFEFNELGEVALGEGMTDLDSWILNMANMAGQLAPTMIPGAGMAGAATKALSLGAKGAKAAQVAGMGLTGGSSATGQAMNQARQEVMNIPDQVLADSDIFQRKFIELDQQSPELDDLAKWNAAKSEVAEQVAKEVRADPKTLLANFAASAIGDPILGKALTGIRLAKSGAFRSALAGAFTEGATEAAQAGTSQYAVDSAVSKLDNRDPTANVKLAALNEGVLGAGVGGVAGFGGGLLNRKPKPGVKNDAADPIREDSPGLASAMDSLAGESVARQIDMAEIAATQTPASPAIDYDQPAAARQAGMGGTMDAGRFGDEVIARDNAMKGRSFPTVPGSDFQRSRLSDAIEQAQSLADNRREGEWLPPETQARPIVTGLLANPAIDSETLNAERTREAMAAQPGNLVGKSSTIFADDGRPAQQRQQFADEITRENAARPLAIEDKGIVFAGDETGVNVKASGKAFASRKEALASKGARQAKRAGNEIEAVKFGKGWGWQVASDVKKPNAAHEPIGNVEQQKVRTGRDEKYGIDVEMTSNKDGSYTIKDSDENSRDLTISSGYGGVYRGNQILNQIGEFVEANEIVQAGTGNISSENTPYKGTKENIKKAVDLVAEIEFSRKTGDMDKVDQLEQDLYNLVTGNTAKSKVTPKATGKIAKVFTPSNKEIETEYQLIESDELIASNDFAGKVDPRYPASRQPRDRSRASSQLQIAAIAYEPNPARLADSAESDRGAPIVSGNVVESGNGRSIGLKEAYARGRAENYRQYLIDNAEQFGFTPEQIRAMKSPVLVRQRLTDLTEDEIRAFTVDSNKSASLELSPMEAAKADAEAVTDDMLDMLSVPDDGNVLSGSNRQFVQAFTRGMNQQELARYLTADGGFNKDFADRVERAIFAKGYDNDTLLELVAESTSTEQKNVLNSLANVAGKMARLRGVNQDVWTEVSNILGDATALVMKARREGKALAELASQGDMMSGYVASEVDTMAAAIDANIRSGKKITALLDGVITSLINANINQGSMFDTEPLSPQQAIAYVKQQQQTQQQAPRPGADLFGANPPKLPRGGEGQTDSVQAAGRTEPEAVTAKPNPNTIFTDEAVYDAAPSKDEAAKTQGESEKAEPITDFGEKIGGAKKDTWQATIKALEDTGTTESQPLSKSWPEPDYQKLIGEGVTPEAAALAAMLRGVTGTKPRDKRRLAGWTASVNKLKEIALSAISGEKTADQAIDSMINERLISSRVNAYEIRRTLPVIAKSSPANFKRAARYMIGGGNFSMFNGVQFDKPKTMHLVEFDGKSIYSTADESLEVVQGRLAELLAADAKSSGTAGDTKKYSKVSVYVDRHTKESFLGWESSTGVLRIKTFPGTKEARAYLEANRDEVEQRLQQMKKIPSERRAENRGRVGPKRYSANVTPAVFAETFGFRGVEFGNWVEQGKRQKDLNEAYDALADLADAIDIPLKALSLNGRLGMAFGARGSGGVNPAKAHYEPGKLVINLTKKAGAGSLAHEWMHALDNYFNRDRRGGDFISDNAYGQHNDPVREPVVNAFKGLMKAIGKDSGMLKRALGLDSTRSKAYWSENTEMLARSFERFIIDELGRKGMSNDYLANIIDEAEWNKVQGALAEVGLEAKPYPYPTNEEAAGINAAFQTLFETIDSRPTEGGNIELFNKNSRGVNRGSRKFSQADAQRAVDDVMKRLSGAAGIRVNLFTSQEEFLERFNVPAMAQQGQTIYGAYDDRRNSAYLILDNFASIDDLRSTLVHEVLAHGGLHTVIGQAKYQEFVKKLTSTRARAELKDLWARIDKDYKGASESVKAEEVFANFVQNQPERGSLKAWWFELKRWLRRQFEGLGILRKNHARNEMEDMVKAIVRGFDKRKQRMDRASAVLERSGKSPADIRYSKAGSITDTPAFKRWFGDSKVVDENGDPLVVYHGTGADFSTFSLDKAGSGTDTGMLGKGFYFSTDPNYASQYARRGESPNVMPVYVSLKKPLVTNNLRDLPAIPEPQTIEEMAIADVLYSQQMRDTLMSQGYDGVIYETPNGTKEIVAFEPTQIKSANGNNGQFDPENPDIRFSMAMEEDGRTAKQKLGLEEQAEESVSERIKAKYRETAGNLKDSKFWNRLKEGIFDGLHGIKQAEEAAGITDPNKMGYVSARLASGLADVLHGVFHYGAPEWRDGIIQRKEGTKGLLEVLGQLPDGELNNWLAWMGANRAKQLKAEGRENNLSQADIDELLALADGKEALFEQVRSEYNAINSAVLDVAQGAGLISAEQRAGFDEQYYVPFFREQDVDPEMQDIHSMVVAPYSKKGIAGQNAKIKELKGGKQSTKDLLENIILRQSTMLDAALKNKAMMEVTDNLTGTDFMTKVDSPEFAKLSQRELNSIQRVKVMRNGQAEAYAVSDPALLRSLIAVNDIGSSSMFNKMGRSFKRFLTTGITLSPDFIFKNFVRDAAQAWMVNKDGFRLGADSIKGLKDAFAEDEAYRDLIFSGAAFQGGYVHGADPEAAAQQIRRALAKKGLGKSEIESYMGSLVTNGGQLLEKYRAISDKVENANRLSTFKAGMNAGKSKRQAAFEAKDLMDYSLKGNFALISTMIDFLPFFNARLQGLYKLGRAAAAGENDKVLKVLSANLAMKGMKVAAFSLALAAMNDDDERYQELPDWDKDANWHFWIGDDHFRIPKPFELGIVFGTLPERMLHLGTGTHGGDDTARAVGNAVFNTLALNPLPQFALPAVEVLVNRSFFKGSPIEGMADQNRQPGDRYNANTSDVARELGQALNVSPKKIEHLIVGYTGTLGGYVLGAADILARQMLGREKAETPISRYPVIKAFYGGDAPKGNTKFQQEFYDALEAAQQAYGSYKRAVEEGDNGRAQQILEDNRDKLAVRLALGRVNRQVSALNKQMEQVNNSSMSPAEKRQRLDEITRQKNAAYQAAYVGLNLIEW